MKIIFDIIKLGKNDFCVLKRECINVIRSLDYDDDDILFTTKYVFDNNIVVPSSAFQLIGLPTKPSKKEKQNIGKTFYLVVYRYKDNRGTAIKIYDCDKYDYVGSNLSE